MIEIRSLTKYYNKKGPPALDNVSFKVVNREILGYVGLNGAGKTTTIKIAAGVLLPTSGDVYIDGFSITEDKVEASKKIGWLPEIPNFNPNEKASRLLRYYAGFHNISSSETEKRVDNLLEMVGLGNYKDVKIRKYSFGMKKRFSLAVSMISNPPNYLFDEVLNGLDPEGIRFFRELTIKFKEEGKSVLFSSHILSEVENIADKIVFLHKGRVIKIIRSEDLSKFGGLVIELNIENIDDKLKKLLEQYGDVSISGNEVIISNSKVESSELNQILISNGYRVSKTLSRRIELEEYFLKLVREGNENV